MIKFNSNNFENFNDLVEASFGASFTFMETVEPFPSISVHGRSCSRTNTFHFFTSNSKAKDKYEQVARHLDNSIFYEYDGDEKNFRKSVAAAKHAALHEEKDHYTYSVVSSSMLAAIKSAFFNDKIEVVDGFTAWKTIRDAKAAEAKNNGETRTAGPRSKIDWSTTISFKDLNGNEFTYDQVRSSHKKIIYIIKDFVNDKGYYFDNGKLRVSETYISQEDKDFIGDDLSNVFYISTKAFMHFVANKNVDGFVTFSTARAEATTKFFDQFKGQSVLINDLDSNVNGLTKLAELAGTKLVEYIEASNVYKDTVIAKYRYQLERRGLITVEEVSSKIRDTYPMLKYVSLYHWDDKAVIDYIKSIG